MPRAAALSPPSANVYRDCVAELCTLLMRQKPVGCELLCNSGLSSYSAPAGMAHDDDH